MLPAAFIKGHDRRRLRNVLAALFVALAIPTGAVIWQAYSQLKWEAWYQYRSQAEALTNRVDAAIGQRIAVAEARNFTDFSFLNATPNAKVLQRSPLAAFPVEQDLPGVIGYFQVDPDGQFSTPLLPSDDADPEVYGLGRDEHLQRTMLASEIRGILAENRLVRDRSTAGGRLTLRDQSADEQVAAVGKETDAGGAPAAAEPMTEAFRSQPVRQLGISTQVSNAPAPSSYEQQAFDQLNQSVADSVADRSAPAAAAGVDLDALGSRANAYGKVQDLKLDENLQKKSATLKREIAAAEEERKDGVETADSRARRVEQGVLPQALATAPAEKPGEGGSDVVTITAFESEVDPFEFSLLDSGHLVLFRNVWRDGSRYIQGLLIDQARFSRDVIESAFQATTLSGMSDLIIGYQDDVIDVVRGGGYDTFPVSAGQLDGSLLFRGRLSAPFESLELIFSINRLPPGPGAGVLGWTTIVIAIVFVGGFLALYRLGLGQIRLARQQQDFVSAVSHELKTPLTSIRMYGEMLKEGWADEAKRKQYYEYIHDESERLTRLISNVLQLANITRNEPQFDLKTTAVKELSDQIRSKISSQVQRAGFELVLTGDDKAGGATISVDDDCFAQIIINLVDNAIKFSKDADRKRIEIGSTLSSDDRVTFTVRDYGPGIPKDQLKKIFKLFYRTESELTRETVGTGIGLAIVHQLTTAMNGSVDVVNKNPGAEFSVSFPSG